MPSEKGVGFCRVCRRVKRWPYFSFSSFFAVFFATLSFSYRFGLETQTKRRLCKTKQRGKPDLQSSLIRFGVIRVCKFLYQKQNLLFRIHKRKVMHESTQSILYYKPVFNMWLLNNRRQILGRFDSFLLVLSCLGFQTPGNGLHYDIKPKRLHDFVK